MNRLQYAQMFLSMGIAVMPLMHRGKDPETSMTGGTTQQFFETIPSTQDVHNWLAPGWQNYGVVCGWGNLVVIDFDCMEYFDIWQLWAAAQIESLRYVVDASFKVKTRRGVHVYLTTLEPAQNEKRIAKSGGIDVQAQHKYVVGPMSIHPSGHVYEPMNNSLIFPTAMDIESILPLDLFPAIVQEPETGAMAPVAIVPAAAEYDPFAAASGVAQGADLIAKVKSHVRIETLFPDARKTSVDGRWYACRCPFHDDGKASFWIDSRQQICGCQRCNMKPMDSINLYARMHNLPESAAVSALAQECGVWG